MKIAYIANIRLPTEKAHGVQIMKMCEAFSKNGVEVLLVVPRRINVIKEDPFIFYNVNNIFKIKRMPSIDLVFLGSFGFLIQTISFLFFAKFFLLFKKYDYLYSRESYTGLFFKEYILEVHSLPVKFVSKVSKFVVLTSFIKKELVELGVDGDNIIVAPDGVDISNYQIKEDISELRKEFNLPLNTKIVGYVGMLRTMNMDKGIGVLIEAMKNIKDALLVLVGGNEEDISYYKKYAKDVGVYEKVLFVGYVKHSLIPKYLKCFDCLVAPFPDNKHYRYYMSPLKIFEYMASKKPIVISDLPSVREVLSEKDCVFAKSNNADSINKAINQVLLDFNLSKEISNNSHNKIYNYCWDKRVLRLIKLLR